MSQLSKRLSIPYIDALLLLLGLGILFFFAPHNISGDAATRFQALSSLLERGEYTPMKYSHALPFLSIPFYFLGKIVMGAQWWISRANLFFFAGFLFFLHRHFRAQLPPRCLGFFMLALTLCSMLPHHLLGFHAEVLTMCLAGSGLLLLPRHAVTATLLLGLAAMNTPACLAGVALGCVWVSVRERRLSCLAPVVVGAALIAGENYFLRGGLWATGYGGEHGARTLLPYSGLPGFSYPILLGLYSILFSSGKGILFFAPGMSLMRRGAVPGVWIAFLVGLVGIYASWWAWYGGFFWGPRFFLFAGLPASLALAGALDCGGRDGQGNAGEALHDAFVLCVLLLSAWVGASGLLFGQSGLDICIADNYAQEYLCWYVPEFSPLARPLIAGHEWGAQRLAYLCFMLAVVVRLGAPVACRLAFALRGGLKGAVSGTWRW